MKKMQFAAIFVLLGLMLSLIVACGGADPTPTAVPPKPTNTAAPPTNTVAPPTNTAVPATNTPAAAPASAADMDLITQAVTATKGLKSYHLLMVASGDVITQPFNIEGDFVAPDKVYVKGAMNGANTETLVTGGQGFEKNADGKWVHLAPAGSSSSGSINLTNIAQDPNVVSSFAPLLQGGTNFTNVGQETLDGVSTTHFTGVVDGAKMMGGGAGSTAGGATLSLGTVGLWIDPSTKFVHKLSMDLDLGPFLKMMVGAFAGMMPTPGPGTPTATPLPASLKFKIDVTLSKLNDPSITVPAAPADALPAPTSTPGGEMIGVTDTPAPVLAATETPAAASTATPGAMAGMAATADDMALITDAFTATAGLKSFHYVQMSGGTSITQPTNLEGDYVAPDKLYGKGTQYGIQGEFLKVGLKSYKKDADGKWAPWTDPGQQAAHTPKESMATSFAGLAGLAAAATYRDTGATDTMDGVATKHFTGLVDLAKMPGMSGQVAGMKNLPPAGTVDIWIDPQTKFLHKVDIAFDMGAAMGALMNQLVTPVPGAPTSTPGPENKFDVHLTLSKLNDPSITVPDAGNTSAAPAATTAPAATSAPAAAGPHHKVGDSVTVAGLKITVTAAKEIPGTSTFAPADGMKFVAVTATFENTTDKEIAVSSVLETNVTDAAGKSYDLGISATLATGGKQPDGAIPAKGTLSGPFGYEIPKDATGLTWTFKDFITDATAVWDIPQ